MGKKCCVATCQRKCYLGCGLSFHRFPKNRDLFEKWLKVIPGRKTQFSVVCSLHFKPEDFVNQPVFSKKYLKGNAVPSLFLAIRPDPAFSPQSVSTGVKTMKMKDTTNNYVEDYNQETDESGDAAYVQMYDADLQESGVYFNDNEDGNTDLEESDFRFNDYNDDDNNNTELYDSEDDLYKQKSKMPDYYFRCKCCLEGRKLRSMWREQYIDGQRKVYGSMLIECFALPWSKPQNPKDNEDLICESCIKKLKDAVSFKKEVLVSAHLLSKQLGTADFVTSNQDDDEDLKFDVQTEYLDVEYPEDSGHYEDDDGSGALGDDDFAPHGGADDDETQDDSIKLDLYRVKTNMNDDDSSTKSFNEDIKTRNNELTVSIGKRKLSTDELENLTAEPLNSGGISSDTVYCDTVKFTGHNHNRGDTKIVNNPYKTIERTINKKIKGYLEEILRCSNATPIGDHTPNGFRCSFCKGLYNSPKNLKYHTLNKHATNMAIHTPIDHIKLDITDLKCLDCCSIIDSLHDFVNHMQTEHRVKMRRSLHYPIVPFKFNTDVMTCALCKKRFKSFEFLNKHMNKHLKNCEKLEVVKDVRIGEDSEIGDNFNKRKNSTDNDKSKDGITDVGRKVKCSSCSFPFDNRRALLVHMNTFHIKLPIKCQYCDSKFLGTKDLTRHVQVKHSTRTP